LKKATFLSEKPDNIKKIYTKSVKNKLREYVDLNEILINKDNIEKHSNILRKMEVAFSTWGMPCFSEDIIKEFLPNLKVVFYAAGSVQSFARPFLNCGVKVVSGWAANAVPVAEYSTAQIILANKGFYQNAVLYKEDASEARKFSSNFPGNYNVNVGIIGAGMIGCRVIELLKPYNINVMVFDPFLSDERANKLGVVKKSLEQVFSTCQTVSNHLANNLKTIGILNKKFFDVMPINATFINTGRGAQVVEKDLIQALKEVPTRTAVLDVTYPEPVQKDSELLKMDNIFITYHIAGSSGNEVERMAWYIVDELIRYESGEKLKYNITHEMLKTMA